MYSCDSCSFQTMLQSNSNNMPDCCPSTCVTIFRLTLRASTANGCERYVEEVPMLTSTQICYMMCADSMASAETAVVAVPTTSTAIISASTRRDSTALVLLHSRPESRGPRQTTRLWFSSAGTDDTLGHSEEDLASLVVFRRSRVNGGQAVANVSNPTHHGSLVALLKARGKSKAFAVQKFFFSPKILSSCLPDIPM